MKIELNNNLIDISLLQLIISACSCTEIFNELRREIIIDEHENNNIIKFFGNWNAK